MIVYNLGGIRTNFDDCMNFIKSTFNCFKSLIKGNYSKEEITYDGCLTFEKIYSYQQLIIPFLYNEIMGAEKILMMKLIHL